MKIYLLIRILAVAGIALAIYLLWQQWALPDFRPCTINATINCDAIITGPVANTFGIPTPLYGLIGYIGIFIAATLRYKKMLLGLVIFGVIFCLWIAYKELVELRVICPVCIMCQTIMITIFGMTLWIWKQSSSEYSKELE